MKNLKGIFLTFCLLVILATNAKATWSIIIIDPKTKKIGIAGAEYHRFIISRYFFIFAHASPYLPITG
jgi:hypothetical protein